MYLKSMFNEVDREKAINYVNQKFRKDVVGW
jgi:hypothetical protein